MSAVLAYLAYLIVAPVLGAVIGAGIGWIRFTRRLGEATERADFLRVAAEGYHRRLVAYEERETRITSPDLGPALARRARR
jgi:hypothetical protein